MSAKFKGQRQWIREILNQYDEVEKLQPGPFNEDPQLPEWVWNLLRILMGISHPGLNIKNAKNWKAKDLGRFLGRQYAIGHLTRNEVPLSAEVREEAKNFTVWAEKQVETRLSAVDLVSLPKSQARGWNLWEKKFKQFMQETVSSAFERPYVEGCTFFEAFGKASIIKPDDLRTERTMGVGDKICWVMLIHWQAIERLPSIAALHRILEQAVKPHGIVLKYKRIEKLCQRIKLKFKSPGRPPSGKIQTNRQSI